MCRYRNIVFDLGGVLFSRDPRKFEREFIEFFSYIMLPEMPKFWEDYDRGASTWDEVLTALAHYNDCPRELAEENLRRSIVTQEAIPSTVELIEELKGRGMRLYVLSNMSLEFIEFLRQHPVYRHFDGEVVSCEEGVVKPEAEIYARLEERYSLHSAETLFVDDRRANVDAAIARGWGGYHFDAKDPEKSCREISKMLLKERNQLTTKHKAMVLNLRLEYNTAYGEDLYVVVGTLKQKAYPMSYMGNGQWVASIKLTAEEELTYHYEVRRGEWLVRKEWGGRRTLALDKKATNIRIADRWADMPHDRSFHSSMFTDGVFARPKRKRAQGAMDGYITIRADIATVRSTESVVLVGEGKALGNWEVSKGIVMSDAYAPVWSARLKAPKGPFAYKFVIVDTESGNVVAWQSGENYYFNEVVAADEGVVVEGLHPRFDLAPWRGAGVAIPVFSLRSESSFGVGEFNDIRLMVDWAKATGQSIIQILPINDTTMTGTWQDSYPYNANSTFALHPQFLHLPAVGKLKDKEAQERFDTLGKELNTLPNVDYERVNNAKNEYLHLIYTQDGKKTLASKDFKAFMEANEEWLRPYAIFCALRDAKGTPDFAEWGSMATYTKAKATKYEKENAEAVAYHYFVQYHLSKQLRDVRDYAHANGVVLKGDIPIGISRTSVDAWVYPELFNMDSSAGAPPDDFSVMGQNWGFPTYNWAKMAEDGYAWWRARFVKMAEYFDAYRIDHILGFFRIWEIPLDAVNALLGRFNPALPYSVDEIRGYGFNFEHWHVGNIAETDNMLFVEDKHKQGHYHPRISAYNTDCYRWLSDEQKEAYNRLYNDFFYRRHNDFWKWEAMKKLPPLTEATRMLVCGEDLGMIPDCVPSVMSGEQILSLEIQRMPKDPKVEFGSTYDYPYLSICTTGTHDMNPLRAWWEEDRGVTQRFYNQVLGAWGEAPYFCEPWIAEQVISMHLKSPAMLTVLPLQDWLAMDGSLRRENPHDERINVPANSRHYWRYRMHMTLEELLKSENLNKMILQKIAESGR